MDSARSEAAINGVKIELQSLILSTQQTLMSAQEAETVAARRVSNLEQEIVRLKDWAADAQRYQLENVGRGAIAYSLKPGMENGEQPHWLCANCFAQRRKSFLQFKGQDKRPSGGNGDESTYACDSCKSSFKAHYTMKPGKTSSEGQHPRTARIAR